MATKRQRPEFREKEAQAKAGYQAPASRIQGKRGSSHGYQAPVSRILRGKEAQAWATRRQLPEFREKEAQANRQRPELRKREAQAMATKRQLPEFRGKEAQAKATNCQRPEIREKEAQSMATKCQRPEFREKEAQAKATKCQCPEFREREREKVHAQKQYRIRRSCTPYTVLQASEAFSTAIKEGPDYICVCCNRLMYRKTVIEFKLTKYSKAPEDFTAPATPGTKQWICRTCDHGLKRGKLPAQAKGNNLHIEDVPPELSDLNPLEVRLISLRIPFMKMVALPCGKQCAIHGPAVNVPTDLTSVCTLLPRLPSQIQMIPMKLKRKLYYKGHYMYQYVRPAKVLAALQWLKSSNPLYKDIEINNDWLRDAAQDDGDLWEALSAQHCPPSPAPTSSAESSSGSSSLNGKYWSMW